MRKFTLILLSLMALVVNAAEPAQLCNVLGRQQISLNGAWNYIVDVQ